MPVPPGFRFRRGLGALGSRSICSQPAKFPLFRRLFFPCNLLVLRRNKGLIIIIYTVQLSN